VPALSARPPTTLTPEQEEILAVLTDQPMRGKEIARGCGHTYNGYFRQLLHDLVVEGHVRQVRGTNGGYRRP
jgi:DNA-binding IscR family transcriptional regulator